MSKQMGKEERKTEETWAELSPAFSFFFLLLLAFSVIWAQARHAQSQPFTDAQKITPEGSCASTSSNWIDKISLTNLLSSCANPGSLLHFLEQLYDADWFLSDWDPLCFDSLYCLAVVLLYMGRYAHINLWATRKTIYSCLSQVCCLTLAAGDYGFLDHGPRHFVPSPDSLWMLLPQIQLYNNYYFDDPFLCILLQFVCNHSNQKM